MKSEIREDGLSIISAGVAFYAFLAIFPALAAMVSIYGLVAEPQDLERQLVSVSEILPPPARAVVQNQLANIVSGSDGALGVGFVFSLALTLWSAAEGVKALMTALNICYHQEETRGLFKFNGVALALTLGAVVAVILTLLLVVAMPALSGNLGLPGWAMALISIVRWLILAAGVAIALAILYRYAPNRAEARWQWVTWGSVFATVIWLIASGLFSFYVSNFENYNKTYGSLGAVVILLLWFYLTAYVVLTGAELNAEIEREARRDDTAGKPERMG